LTTPLPSILTQRAVLKIKAHGLPGVGLILLLVGDVIAEVSGENHPGDTFLIACASSDFYLLEIQRVKKVKKCLEIHSMET